MTTYQPLQNKPKPTKRRRKWRLKKSFKRTVYIIALSTATLIAKPWNWFHTAEAKLDTDVTTKIDTTQISINKLVSNADSDIPEAEKFDKAINQFLNQWEIVGASLAIMKDGNLIYSKGYGFADKENQTPTEVKHIFRMASVSKLITAVGIMKLCEQGKLSLNSKVFGKNGILPQFSNYNAAKAEKITVDHLLQHKAGFSTRAGDPMFDAAKMGLKLPVSENQMIDFAVNKLQYQPGARYAYSNVGYLVLSKIIEQVTKMPYETYIKDSILAPIGCYDMHIGHNEPSLKHENEVKYYEPKEEEPIPAADGSGRMIAKSRGGNNIELLSGAGGWVASPVEVLKLVAAIDHKNPHTNILSNASIKQMTDYDKHNKPIGWINVSKDGDWWRSGTMAGTSAMVRRQNNGYTWVFVTNTSSWKGSRFASMINSMLKKAFTKVTEWPEKDLFELENEQQEESI